MEFVFSPWYFVMIGLVIGIIVCFIIFFKMDRKDKQIIKKFIEETQKQAEEVSNVEDLNVETAEVEETVVE